jgi:hypothetical protein
MRNEERIKSIEMLIELQESRLRNFEAIASRADNLPEIIKAFELFYSLAMTTREFSEAICITVEGGRWVIIRFNSATGKNYGLQTGGGRGYILFIHEAIEVLKFYRNELESSKPMTKEEKRKRNNERSRKNYKARKNKRSQRV